MRLKISESKNAASLYVIKSIYVNNKRSTKIVEKLGTVAELEKRLNGENPIEWAKKYIEVLNKKEIWSPISAFSVFPTTERSNLHAA